MSQLSPVWFDMTTTQQSMTKLCAYFMENTMYLCWSYHHLDVKSYLILSYLSRREDEVTAVVSLHCWYHSHIDLSHRLHSHPSNGARRSEVAKCLIKKWPCVNFQFQFHTQRIAYNTNMSHHFRHVFIGSLTHNRSNTGGSIEESIEPRRACSTGCEKAVRVSRM